jgi:hypothetical protein
MIADDDHNTKNGHGLMGSKREKDLCEPTYCTRCDYIDYFGTITAHRRVHRKLKDPTMVTASAKNRIQPCPFGEYVTL